MLGYFVYNAGRVTNVRIFKPWHLKNTQQKRISVAMYNRCLWLNKMLASNKLISNFCYTYLHVGIYFVNWWQTMNIFIYKIFRFINNSVLSVYVAIMYLQSTLDISKLWGLFFTSSNYAKCKLICTSGNLDL